ncbi:MAG: 6-hydroxymethylpterin diphosphokinase MptE-like protein, partial [Candidatus Odinarchaeota archaeon]
KRKLMIIAVDGALTALIENKLNPNILVTDLDGFKLEFLNQVQGGLIAVHAHGDNIDKIKNYPTRLLSRTLGTCQVDFNKNILNIGGFTDGDRAVCLCECFEAGTVFLLGMDFGYTVGSYSKPHLNRAVKASLVKRRKMVYAMNIIKELVFNSDIKYYCLLQSSELDSIPVMKMEEFKNYIKDYY